MSESWIVSAASGDAMSGAVASVVATAGGHVAGSVEIVGAICGEAHSDTGGPS